MKNVFFICLLLPMVLAAQEFTGRSKPISANISTEAKPPQLSLVQGSIKLIDENNNNCIDAMEKCTLEFEIQNNGFGDAFGLSANITNASNAPGITFNSSYKLPAIKVGEKSKVSLPFTTDMNTAATQVQLSIKINEPNGFGMPAFPVAVHSKPFAAPAVAVASYAIANLNGKTLAHIYKVESFKLTLRLLNSGSGAAQDVSLKILLPDNVLNLSSRDNWKYSEIKPNQYQDIEVTLAVNELFSANVLNVQCQLTEKYNKFAQGKNIALAIGQKSGGDGGDIQPIPGNDNQNTPPPPNQQLLSDVDNDIPIANTPDDKTLVFIIANEQYKYLSKVDFAINDGTSFYNYCKIALGVPEKNIKFISNTTKSEIKREIGIFAETIDTYGGNAKVLFYYTGHGMPNPADKEPYIVPVDAVANDFENYFKLNDVYAALTKYQARNVTAFIDACFTGMDRNNVAIDKNRSTPVMPDIDENTSPKNLVVFSATDFKQPAYAYDKQYHGAFTYHLLEKIKLTKGSVSYNELQQHLSQHVKRTVLQTKGQVQTPQLFCHPDLKNNLQNLKLK